MAPVPDPQLVAFAEIIIRIGLNLRAGQGLLITDPYGWHGVDPSAAPLVSAIESAARAAGARDVHVTWSDPRQVRQLFANNDPRGFVSYLKAQNAPMVDALRSRHALLFLQSSPRSLWRDASPARAAQFHALAWEQFGPIAQPLTAGATNWCAAPAPTEAWANEVYADRPAPERLPALWRDVFASCHVAAPTADTNPALLTASALTAGAAQLSALLTTAADLNRRCVRRVRFSGPGTDLEVKLPAAHVWTTARLQDQTGRAFLANLPSAEVFTAPDRASASGRVRVARPVEYAGTVIEGLELEFARGAVVAASARRGAEAIEQLLAVDEGARYLGEIAWIPQPPGLDANRFYGLALLDENAASHVALGAAYPFNSSKPEDPRLNRSLIHLDLPLAAEVSFID